MERYLLGAAAAEPERKVPDGEGEDGEDDEDSDESGETDDEAEEAQVKRYYAGGGVVDGEDGGEDGEDDDSGDDEEGAQYDEDVSGSGETSVSETSDEDEDEDGLVLTTTKLDDDEDFARLSDEAFSDENYGDDGPQGAAGDAALEARLRLAFSVATQSADGMGRAAFKQALAMLGKVVTAEDLEVFFREAQAHGAGGLGETAERDGRGAKRAAVAPVASGLLGSDTFCSYFQEYLTRRIDSDEAALNFRALVEGAAEMVLHGKGQSRDDAASRNEALAEMEDTKHLATVRAAFVACPYRESTMAKRPEA